MATTRPKVLMFGHNVLLKVVVASRDYINLSLHESATADEGAYFPAQDIFIRLGKNTNSGGDAICKSDIQQLIDFLEEIKQDAGH